MNTHTLLKTSIIVIGLACLTAITSHTSLLENPTANAQTDSTFDGIQTPLSTRGSEIIDANGTAIQLHGLNWFGFETDTHIVHGLWARDYESQLQQISELGYNTIRLPYSVQMLDEQSINGVDFSQGSNSDFQNKTPLEAMDIFIKKAAQYDLMILLDSHRLNNQYIPELWYDNQYSEQDWIDAWTQLAERYKDEPNVIGADLKNEPHGAASWGTGSQTDWRLAAERAGNAVLDVAPHWLIVVEGVETNVQGGHELTHWWGANLEGADSYPVRLDTPNKLVYSTHEYGPGVYDQDWFYASDFPTNLYERWETGFFYLMRENTAPVLIGEFGGREVDQSSREGVWQNTLVDFIDQHDISYTYWSWNPNSGDTGGILQDNWYDIHQDKQAMLDRIQDEGDDAPEPSPVPTPTPSPVPSTSPTPSPSPTPIPSPSPVPSPTPPPSSESTLDFVLQSSWNNGYCGALRVKTGSTELNNWDIDVTLNQGRISSSWNATFSDDSGEITVTPPSWLDPLSANTTNSDMGFCVETNDPRVQPAELKLNGAQVPTPSPTPSPSPVPTPRPTPSPTPIPSPTPPPTGDFLPSAIAISNEWQGGYCAEVTVSNTTTSTVTDWQSQINISGTIYNSWNIYLSDNSGIITATPVSWARTLQPGQSFKFGFCANR